MMYYLSMFFFFKQKTAYEMRISDWSSDVCSSDLVGLGRHEHVARCGECHVLQLGVAGCAVDDHDVVLVLLDNPCQSLGERGSDPSPRQVSRHGRVAADLADQLQRSSPRDHVEVFAHVT